MWCCVCVGWLWCWWCYELRSVVIDIDCVSWCCGGLVGCVVVGFRIMLLVSVLVVIVLLLCVGVVVFWICGVLVGWVCFGCCWGCRVCWCRIWCDGCCWWCWWVGVVVCGWLFMVGVGCFWMMVIVGGFWWMWFWVCRVFWCGFC